MTPDSTDPGLLDRLTALAGQAPRELDPLTLAALLALSLAASLVVAWAYLRFAASRTTGTQIHRTFPLVAVAVTAIFLCVQFSLPLSLGLLGALSIVRFRTPIKEPEEVGFILLVIATSLACATANLALLGGLLVVAGIALVVRRFARGLFRADFADGSILVSLPAAQYAERGAELLAFLERELPRPNLESLTVNGDDVVLCLAFRPVAGKQALAVESGLRALVAPRQLTLFPGGGSTA